MATRRQRGAPPPHPRQAATASAGTRNQTAAAAAAAAATGQRHARNRRALGNIGNHVNAPGLETCRLHRHREANRCRLTRSLSLSARPNAAAAGENTNAPAHPEAAAAFTEAAEEQIKMPLSLVHRLERLLNQYKEKYEESTGDYQRLVAKTNELESEKAQKEAEIQKVMEELESEKVQKEYQVQKVMEVMEENVRLLAMLDKKEAQLQAMSEQCKFMVLNNRN